MKAAGHLICDVTHTQRRAASEHWALASRREGRLDDSLGSAMHLKDTCEPLQHLLVRRHDLELGDDAVDNALRPLLRRLSVGALLLGLGLRPQLGTALAALVAAAEGEQQDGSKDEDRDQIGNLEGVILNCNSTLSCVLVNPQLQECVMICEDSRPRN